MSSAEDLTTKPNNGDERGLALPKPLRHLASTICIKFPHPSTPVPVVDLSSMTTLWRGNQVKTGSPQGLLIKWRVMCQFPNPRSAVPTPSAINPKCQGSHISETSYESVPITQRLWVRQKGRKGEREREKKTGRHISYMCPAHKQVETSIVTGSSRAEWITLFYPHPDDLQPTGFTVMTAHSGNVREQFIVLKTTYNLHASDVILSYTNSAFPWIHFLYMKVSRYYNVFGQIGNIFCLKRLVLK